MLADQIKMMEPWRQKLLVQDLDCEPSLRSLWARLDEAQKIELVSFIKLFVEK